MSNKEISADVIDEKGIKFDDINVLSNDRFQFRINDKGFLEMRAYPEDWVFIPKDLREYLIIVINKFKEKRMKDRIDITNQLEAEIDNFKTLLIHGIGKDSFKKISRSIKENYKPSCKYEDINLDETFLVSAKIDEFHGYKNVNMIIFRWDTESCPFDPYSKGVGLGFFNYENMILKHKQCFTFNEISKIKVYLDLVDNINVEKLIPMEWNNGGVPYYFKKETNKTGFYPFYKLEGYSLPFKIVGFYDLRLHKKITK